MSVKILNFFGILLCFLFINHSSAAVLNCQNSSADDCKAKFSEIFDGESKAFHSTYSKNVLEKYVETYNTILAELPENDKHRAPIRAKVEELTSKMASFNQGQENVKDTVALMMSAEEKFEPDFTGIDFDKASKLRYKRLKKIQSKKMTEHNNQESAKIYDNIMGLWFQLYSGLRKSDLKAFSDYTEVNSAFKGLEAAQPGWKSMLYWGAVEKSTEFLKLEYYQKILDEIHEQAK